MPVTQYIGIIVQNGSVQDVMLYPNQQEAIDNLLDSLPDGFNIEQGEAVVYEHVDLENGDQETNEVFNLADSEVNP